MSSSEKKTAKGTQTSTFGVSKRESHNAKDFYDRFPPLKQDKEQLPEAPKTVNELFVGDSRHMDDVNDNSVALVSSHFTICSYTYKNPNYDKAY